MAKQKTQRSGRMSADEIAAIRRAYYDLISAGYSKEEAAAVAQGNKEHVEKVEETPAPIQRRRAFETPTPAPTPPVKAPKAEPDDLTKITGIGTGTVKKLSNLGVTSFAQIAAWSEKDIEKMDSTLGVRGRIKRDDWVGQAKGLL